MIPDNSLVIRKSMTFNAFQDDKKITNANPVVGTRANIANSETESDKW